MKNIRSYFITACMLFAASFGYADSELIKSSDYLKHLDNYELSKLNEQKMIFRYDVEENGPEYIMKSVFTDDILKVNEELKPEVFVEAVYMIDYPADFSNEIDYVLKHLNMLTHKVSSITGAMYFSRTEDDYAVLFEEVYAVDNPESKKRISDPEVKDIIAEKDSIFMYMDEHSLGPGYYKMDYMNKGDEFLLSITNDSPMSKFFTVVKPGDMKIMLQFIPCSDVILVYGYCGVVLQNDGFVKLLMDPYYSFYRRMTAMETWLYNSLHGTEVLPPLYEPLP